VGEHGAIVTTLLLPDNGLRLIESCVFKTVKYAAGVPLLLLLLFLEGPGTRRASDQGAGVKSTLPLLLSRDCKGGTRRGTRPSAPLPGQTGFSPTCVPAAKKAQKLSLHAGFFGTCCGHVLLLVCHLQSGMGAIEPRWPIFNFTSSSPFSPSLLSAPCYALPRPKPSCDAQRSSYLRTKACLLPESINVVREAPPSCGFLPSLLSRSAVRTKSMRRGITVKAWLQTLMTTPSRDKARRR